MASLGHGQEMVVARTISEKAPCLQRVRGWARLGSNHPRTPSTLTDSGTESPTEQRKDEDGIFAAGPALGDESSGDVVVGWSHEFQGSHQRVEATTTPEGAKGWVDQAGSAQVLAGGHGLNGGSLRITRRIRAKTRRANDGAGGEPSNAPEAASLLTEWPDFPWRLRDASLLTAWDHAEMLDVLARVTEAFDELGAAA